MYSIGIYWTFLRKKGSFVGILKIFSTLSHFRKNQSRRCTCINGLQCQLIAKRLKEIACIDDGNLAAVGNIQKKYGNRRQLFNNVEFNPYFRWKLIIFSTIFVFMQRLWSWGSFNTLLKLLTWRYPYQRFVK